MTIKLVETMNFLNNMLSDIIDAIMNKQKTYINVSKTGTLPWLL